MATTDEAYRAFCRKLIKLGIAQKTIGAHAGHKSGWASKWINGKAGNLKTDSLDGLNKYFDQLDKLLKERPAVGHAKEPPGLQRKAV